jgi:hypothetical protein
VAEVGRNSLQTCEEEVVAEEVGRNPFPLLCPPSLGPPRQQVSGEEGAWAWEEAQEGAWPWEEAQEEAQEGAWAWEEA